MRFVMHFVRTAQIDRLYHSLLYSNDKRNILQRLVIIIIFQRNNKQKSKRSHTKQLIKYQRPTAQKLERKT